MILNLPYGDWSALKVFNNHEVQQTPNSEVGIYVIWSGRNCVYVGETSKQSIRARLLSHLSDSHNPYLNEWIRAKTILKFHYSVHVNHLQIKMFESELIKLLTPKCNIKGI